jgi:hypothetical protein
MNASKQEAPVLNWKTINDSFESVATTLYVNIKAIRDLMRTDAFEQVSTTETYDSTEKALQVLSTKYLDRLNGLQGGHANRTGTVRVEELHEYMYYSQQYHELRIDIAATATQLSKILINLREQHITQEQVDAQ